MSESAPDSGRTRGKKRGCIFSLLVWFVVLLLIGPCFVPSSDWDERYSELVGAWDEGRYEEAAELGLELTDPGHQRTEAIYMALAGMDEAVEEGVESYNPRRRGLERSILRFLHLFDLTDRYDSAKVHFKMYTPCVAVPTVLSLLEIGRADDARQVFERVGRGVERVMCPVIAHYAHATSAVLADVLDHPETRVSKAKLDVLHILLGQRDEKSLADFKAGPWGNPWRRTVDLKDPVNAEVATWAGKFPNDAAGSALDLIGRFLPISHFDSLIHTLDEKGQTFGFSTSGEEFFSVPAEKYFAVLPRIRTAPTGMIDGLGSLVGKLMYLLAYPEALEKHPDRTPVFRNDEGRYSTLWEPVLTRLKRFRNSNSDWARRVEFVGQVKSEQASGMCGFSPLLIRLNSMSGQVDLLFGQMLINKNDGSIQAEYLVVPDPECPRQPVAKKIDSDPVVSPGHREVVSLTARLVESGLFDRPVLLARKTTSKPEASEYLAYTPWPVNAWPTWILFQRIKGDPSGQVENPRPFLESLRIPPDRISGQDDCFQLRAAPHNVHVTVFRRANQVMYWFDEGGKQPDRVVIDKLLSLPSID